MSAEAADCVAAPHQTQNLAPGGNKPPHAEQALAGSAAPSPTASSAPAAPPDKRWMASMAAVIASSFGFGQRELAGTR